MFASKASTLSVAFVALASTVAFAQNAPAPKPAPAPDPAARVNWAEFAVAPNLVPLKVQVVISRYQGDKKISSMPYTLSVNANDRVQASLRMGAQVPLPTVVAPLVEPGKPNPFGGPVQYRDIGTYIDCSARALDDGRYRLSISIDDSSVYASDAQTQNGSAVPATPPAIRSFKLSNTAVLKDGQTTQFTAATDKLNGETTRIDLTLNVVK